jgi:hypothetical protein
MAVSSNRIFNFDVDYFGNEIQNVTQLTNLLKTHRLIFCLKDELPILHNNGSCVVKFKDNQPILCPTWMTKGFVNQYLVKQTAQVSNNTLSFEKHDAQTAIIFRLLNKSIESKDAVPIKIEILLVNNTVQILPPPRGPPPSQTQQSGPVRQTAPPQMPRAPAPAPPPYVNEQTRPQINAATEVSDDESEPHMIDHLLDYLIETRPSTVALRHYYQQRDPPPFTPSNMDDHQGVINILRMTRVLDNDKITIDQVLDSLKHRFNEFMINRTTSMKEAINSFSEEIVADALASFLTSIACFHNKEELEQIKTKKHSTCTLLRQCPFFIECEEHSSIRNRFTIFDDYVSYILFDNALNNMCEAAEHVTN